ncbi:MAG: hypothetical protein AAB250_10450, partial [Bdellovibrionota bacterium]
AEEINGYEENENVIAAVAEANVEANEAAFVSSAFRVAFAVLAEVIVGSSRMVRRVGPNERPEERYEFENLDHQNVRGPGFRVF